MNFAPLLSYIVMLGLHMIHWYLHTDVRFLSFLLSRPPISPFLIFFFCLLVMVVKRAQLSKEFLRLAPIPPPPRHKFRCILIIIIGTYSSCCSFSHTVCWKKSDENWITGLSYRTIQKASLLFIVFYDSSLFFSLSFSFGVHECCSLFVCSLAAISPLQKPHCDRQGLERYAIVNCSNVGVVRTYTASVWKETDGNMKLKAEVVKYGRF